MNYSELQKLHTETVNNIVNHKLVNAFSILQKMISHCTNTDYINQYESQYSTYENMLKYSFEYQDDPEKGKVYKHLIRSMLKLADDVKEEVIYSKKLKKYYLYKDEIRQYYNINEKESSNLVDIIAFEKEIDDILAEINTGVEHSNDDFESKRTKIENLFKFLWLTDTYRNVEVDLVTKIFSSNAMPWYNKSLIASAVSLSLLRNFDENKFIILFNAFDKGEEQVWQRAFIGLVFALIHFDNRIEYYPEVKNRLKILQENDSFIQYMEMFAIQFTWQKESEKIAKRINEELMPDMMKMKSIIEDKLDLDNIVSLEDMQDKNPDWEDYFKDSPGIYQKFEEIQNLQTEGADVFMGAFSMLKQFPFFNEISNWFVPFYSDNNFVKQVSQDVDNPSGFDSVVQGLEGTFFLCNSDKYSFCHNLSQIIKMQNPGMMDMFKQELDSMNELAKDEEHLNINVKNKSIFTQYFQDLYRFYMLYPDRNEFENVFNLKTDLHKTSFMQKVSGDSKIVHKLGAFYFNHEYYDKALDIFIALSEKDNSSDLLEKIAYSYQKSGKLDDAIFYYEKALYIDKNKKWKTQQLAFCLRKKQEYKKALNCLKELEKDNPDDLNLQAELGHLHLCLEDFENALQYYFKVEYLAPENLKVRRPLAWCSYMLGKLEASQKYYEKIMGGNFNKNDLLNFGHVMWSQNNKSQAISCYKQAYAKSSDDRKWFEKVMLADSKHLLNNGVEPLDIHLMIDYIKMGVEAPK